MDFIERLFGLSPDSGDGSMEVLWLVALVVVMAVAIYIRRRRTTRVRIFGKRKRWN